MALALAALGYSINTEDEKEIEEAKQLLIDVKPNVDTINSTYIERATRGEIDFGMGWNGDVRRAIVALAKKDREMVFLIPEGNTEYWVDNWVIPTDVRAPRRRAQVDRLRARPGRGRQGDELPPVRGAGRRASRASTRSSPTTR